LLLGFANIDLATKIPWNSEDYKPPRQHEIMESNVKVLIFIYYQVPEYKMISKLGPSGTGRDERGKRG